MTVREAAAVIVKKKKKRVLITVALGRVPDYAAPDIRGTSAGRQQWDVGRSHVFRTSEGRLVLSGK